MPRRNDPVGFKPKIHPHELRVILQTFGAGTDWRKLGSSWGPLTALQVGKAMHHANADRCRSCRHMAECPIEDHHFYGSTCEFCVDDGIDALNEMAERGLVELHVSGTPTEKAKEMQFERESADLLAPGRDRYVKVGAWDD